MQNITAIAFSDLLNMKKNKSKVYTNTAAAAKAAMDATLQVPIPDEVFFTGKLKTFIKVCLGNVR